MARRALVMPLQEQIKAVAEHVKELEQYYAREIAANRITRAKAEIEYSTWVSAEKSLRMAAKGDIGLILERLNELPDDVASAKESLIHIMQENSRLIGEKQDWVKQRDKIFEYLVKRDLISAEFKKELFDVDEKMIATDMKLEAQHGI